MRRAGVAVNRRRTAVCVGHRGATDADGLSGHGPGVIACQERDRRRDIFLPAGRRDGPRVPRCTDMVPTPVSARIATGSVIAGMMINDVRTGGCACGAARFTARGRPLRVGLCHCLTCRKAHASAFSAFVVFARQQVEVEGELSCWASSASYERCFCPACGSRVIGLNGDEVELSLGSFDEPGLFEPQYESWVTRREPWLPSLGIEQHERDRPTGGASFPAPGRNRTDAIERGAS